MSTTEVIFTVISIVIDIITLVVTSYSLLLVIKVSKHINFTDNSKVKNSVNSNIGGDYIGRDKNR